MVASNPLRNKTFSEELELKLSPLIEIILLPIICDVKVISEDAGYKLENATLEYLGTSKRVVSDKDNSTIVGGSGTKDSIKARINEIKVQIDKTSSDFDREKLQERLAKLSGGVAVINVGAPTEVEMKFIL